MKNITLYFLARHRAAAIFVMLLAVLSSPNAFAQTVFSENMGTPGSTTQINNNVFQNSGTLTYSNGGQASSADIRSTSVSSGYTGASGGGNVWFASTAGAFGFSIESIDASAYTSLKLNYGYRKESGSGHASFSVDYWNGTAWVTLANTASALFNEAVGATANWYAAKQLSLPAAAQISGLKIRFVKTGSTAIRIDDVKLTGVLAAQPTKLVVTGITPANPTMGVGFDVTVQAQDASGNPVNVTGSPVHMFLDSNGNAGDIYASGNQNGDIPVGSPTGVISGVIMPSAGTGVTVTAYDSNFVLTAGTSAPFSVLAPASQLAFVGFPSTGSVGVPVTQFSVEARRPDNSLDNSYTGTITLTKASGPGSLSGTPLSVAAVAGVATFNNVQFTAAGTYALHADAAGLSQATSGNIAITLAPVAIAEWDFSTLSGGTGDYGPSPYSATATDSHVSVGGLTRGSSLTQSGTAASSAWGATGWDQGSSLATAISNNSFVTFTVTANSGYQLSLSSAIAYNVRRSSSGPSTGQWQYSINGGTYNNIGTAITWTDTTSSGNSEPAISLSGISALQNIPPGTTVTFRIVNYGATNTSGTWYLKDLGNSTTVDFGVTGNALCVQPTAFNVTGGGSYCTGGSGSPVGLSGSQVGISYQLKRNGTNTDAPVNGTGSAIAFATQSTAGTYTVQATNTTGGCGGTLAMTGSVTVSVDPASVAGTISGNGTVCAGTNSTVLTLSGYLGAIQWQSSPDNSTFTNIVGATSNTYTATNLSATTYYHAVVASGSCTPATSASVAITVTPAAVGGTISGGTTVCTGTNSTTLTLNGSNGSIQWQSSPDNSTYTNIAGATSNTYTATNLTATTYYRAVLSSSPCASVNSTVATITVSPVAVGGTISGSATVCSGTNSMTLSLSGSTGSVQWQSSPDNNTFTDIAGATSNTYTATNLTATTYYRAVLSSSPCSSANSTVATITVSPAAVAGSISGGGTSCAGDAVIISLSGYSGSIQWQSSADDAAFTDIAGQTSASLGVTAGTLTYYRAKVTTGGPCGAVYSASASVSAGASTTWDGTSWSNGAPDGTMSATIAGNYTATGNLDACTVTVTGNAVVDIPSGYDVTLNGALSVGPGSSFTLENDANLLQNTSAANSGSITVKRNSSAIKRQDYTLWSSPVANQNLLAFSPMTVVSPTSRFYQYNSSTNQYNSVTSPGTTTFNDAQGYLIRVANNHPTFAWIWNGQFSGTPHNGDYGYALYNNGAGFGYNLVGNPYPSPISAADFVSQNASQITGTLYFWRETNGNPNNNPYCTWSPAGGGNGTFVSNGEAQVNDPQGVIQTGQGFFVESSATGTSVAFHNNMRLANNANQFFRHNIAQSPQDGASRLWLNATNAQGAFCQAAIAYTQDATNGYDIGLDGKSISSPTTDLYMMVEGQKLSIQARAGFDASDIVPLAFKAATAGDYSIALDHTDGLFSQDQNVYLRDNLTGDIHDLKASAYGFTSDAGTFESRFDILYQMPLAVNNPTLDNQLVIYKQGGKFEISAGQMEMASVRVFDIGGRLITEMKKVNSTHAGFDAGKANQVLIVRITGMSGEKAVRKVIN
jgi:hypothetical protein